MTIERALQVLHRLGRAELVHNPLLTALVQKDAGRHHHRHRLRSSTAPNTVTPAPNSGVALATNMLNEMIAEAEHKLDLEEVRCSEFEKKQLELIEQTKQDIAMYNAIAAEARADILSAQTQIEMITQKIPELNASLDQLLQKCAAETATLRSQLAVLEADIQVINRVVAMTDCAPGSSSSTLVQLPRTQLHLRSCTPAKTTDPSFIEFTHPALNKAVVGLKSEVAKVGLQRHLEQAFQETKQLTAMVERAAQDHVQQPPAPTSAAPPGDQATKKCTVARSPVCHKMLA